MEDNLKTIVVVIYNSQYISIKNFIDSRYNNDETKLDLYGYIKNTVKNMAYALSDFLEDSNIGTLVNQKTYSEYSQFESFDDSEIGENDYIIETTDVDSVLDFLDSYKIHNHKLKYTYIIDGKKEEPQLQTSISKPKEYNEYSQKELMSEIDKALDKGDYDKVKMLSSYLKESTVLNFKYFVYKIKS